MRRVLALLCLLLSAFAALADVAFNAAATPDTGGAVTTLTTSINPTGSDRIVIIGIAGTNQTAAPTVTYGAQTPTLLEDNDPFEPSLWLYYVVPSGSGSQTIDVTFGASSSRCALMAVSYTGVDQGSPVGTAVLGTTSNATTHQATPVSSATGGMVVDVAFVGGQDISVGSGQTARADIDDVETAFVSFGMSDEPGAATVTMSWATTTNVDGSVIAVPLNASAGGGPSALPKIIQQLDH